MLPALHELLIQRDALLAERTALRRVGGEVATHEAEDLLAVDLSLLGPAPERADAHDLTAEALHELGQQSDRAAGAHEVLHEEHLRPLPNQPVELGGQR